MSSESTSFSDSDSDFMSSPSSPSSPPDNGVDGGVGLSDATLSGARRKLLDLVNRLHATGVQKDIDLPLIAVIGSQSAGKSSLIESISGITLPRAAGTCTRCPTECKLAHSSEPWKCIVSLRFSTGPDGRLLGQVKNVPFGETITDKSQVEERIRRAQRAILNPSMAYRTFLEGEDADLGGNEQSFSTNCVSLQISGPSVADLSFCDLPGLIASVSSSGQEGDIRLIEGLLSSYISKPSCIILLTVACETDFENQGAHRLAKEKDPEGKRTIGVLTKPDRIPPGEEDRWVSFIRNEREPLENNWYSVKQPNSKSLSQGVTWSQAREQERAFFQHTAPWSQLDGTYQAYLGTGHLVNRLSLILSDLIAKRLPEIQEELQEMIQTTEGLLARLPKPPSEDPFAEILVMLQEFVRDVSKRVEGIPEASGLLQQLRPRQMQFRRAIRITAPNFRPFKRSVVNMRMLMRPEFLDHEEEEVEEMMDVLCDRPEAESVCYEVYEEYNDDTPYTMQAESNGKSHDPVIERKDTIQDRSPYDLELEEAVRKARDEVICIDEVMTKAQDARTRELPGNYPFAVKAWYISQFTQKWDAPAKALSHVEHGIVSEYFKSLISDRFAGFGTGGLDQRIRLIVNDHIKLCFSKGLDKVAWLLALETNPFTLNTHYLADYKDKFYAYYKAARDNDMNTTLTKAINDYKYQLAHPPPSEMPSYSGVRTSSLSRPQQSGIEKILSGFAEIGLYEMRPEDAAKMLPPDPMESALDIMADVRAYFQVAYKRFVDAVPLALDHELVLGLSRDLLPALLNGLKLNGPDPVEVCRELMQENRGTAAKRLELSKKLERLRMASAELLTMS